jgi:hypothetical protein
MGRAAPLHRQTLNTFLTTLFDPGIFLGPVSRSETGPPVQGYPVGRNCAHQPDAQSKACPTRHVTRPIEVASTRRQRPRTTCAGWSSPSQQNQRREGTPLCDDQPDTSANSHTARLPLKEAYVTFNSKQRARREPLYDINPQTGISFEVFYSDRTLETFGRGGAGWFWWARRIADQRRKGQQPGRLPPATQRFGTR